VNIPKARFRLRDSLAANIDDGDGSLGRALELIDPTIATFCSAACNRPPPDRPRCTNASSEGIGLYIPIGDVVERAPMTAKMAIELMS